MAHRCNPVGVKIEPHVGNFPEDDDCLICQTSEVAETPSRFPTEGLWDDRRFTIVLSGPTYRPPADNDLVHLSCHTDRVYHYKCIKAWIRRNASCPLDRRVVAPRPVMIEEPGVNLLFGTTESIIYSVALRAFRFIQRFLDLSDQKGSI